MREFMMAGLLMLVILAGLFLGSGCAQSRAVLSTEVKMQAMQPDNPELSIKYSITMP